MRKILMLHGYTQNGSIFSKRMGAIRKACEKKVEFVFPDAPTILHPVDIPVQSREWLEAAASNTLSADNSNDPALTPRAWWKANAERTVMEGLERSLESLKEVLKNNTFDGVLGFSQGAAMAGVLAAILERPESYPSYTENGVPIHPKLKFFIPISGFRARDPLLENILSASTPKLITYSVHVLGDTDVVVVAERSQALIESCDENYTRVERHEGGHFVPSKTNWRVFFRDFLSDWSPGVEIPSPSAQTEGQAKF